MIAENSGAATAQRHTNITKRAPNTNANACKNRRALTFEVVIVAHNSTRYRAGHVEDAALRLGFVANITIFAAHANHVA